MKTIIKNIMAAIQQPQFIRTVVCLIFIMVAMLPSLHAQTITDPGGSGDPDAAAPIDGGLSLLVAAGVGYGAKKMKERRQQQEK
jgi:hypothetical protein